MLLTLFYANSAVKALEEAIFNRFPNGIHPEIELVLRVDRGSQFIARIFKQTAQALGLKLMFCGIQCPNDKPHIENFFSKYKIEEVYRNYYDTFEEAENAWLNYKFWYNVQRLHQSLGYQTPREFALAHGSYQQQLPDSPEASHCPTIAIPL